MGKKCVLSTDAGNAVFIINDTKMYVPVVTLSKEDNKDLIEQQIKDFKDLFIGTNIKQKDKMKMLMLMNLSILI